jgi:glucuronoarabinoxylan endo-1,4-beta-xylanase
VPGAGAVPSFNSGFLVKYRLVLSVALALCAFARAGLVVTQNVSPGATYWPGTPVILTVTNPASQTSVAESFNAVGGCTNYGETFTITTTNYSLQTICLYAGGGTGTVTGASMTLRLFDLGSQSAPAPSPYTPGTDLFNSGNGLALTYTNQTTGVLQFGLTGSDQVVLTNGHMYVFEMDGVSNTAPLLWERTTNDSYSGGAAYRNRSWINGSNARDFALAVYGTPANGTVTSSTITTNYAASTVDWNEVHQRMDGFGAGVVFLDGGLDPVAGTNMDTLFRTNSASQLGLSLLRVRIDPTTNWSAALADAQLAVARGAGVLATPWTPPAAMKDNGVLTNGSLLAAQYANYANYLKNFAGYMSSNNATLRAISVQNEPDWGTTYESCVWTSNQFLAFFRTNAAALHGTPVLMPESLSFNTIFSDPTFNDSVAVTNVSLLGGHLYGVTTIPANTNALAHGKPVWMTEYLVNDQTINTAVVTARQIHDCLTIGNMSAYIWWKSLGDANGLVSGEGVPQPRGFAMAQFSRFVRPNFYRIGATFSGTNAAVTAFKDTNSPNFAIVAVNTNATTVVVQTFGFTNFNCASVTPWITSGSLSLAAQTAVTVTNGSFSYSLPALSVVTFVGQAATNSPPVFAAIPNQVINPGATLMLTNLATNSLAQTITYQLVNAPTNAALNSASGIFTWRPLLSQANTTNPVAVAAYGNTATNLTATNTFKVVVNPVVPPVVSASLSAAGKVSLVLNGAQGPDYSLLVSSNLASWQTLFSTNSPALPVTVTETNTGQWPARFYRALIGP